MIRQADARIVMAVPQRISLAVPDGEAWLINRTHDVIAKFSIVARAVFAPKHWLTNSDDVAFRALLSASFHNELVLHAPTKGDR